MGWAPGGGSDSQIHVGDIHMHRWGSRLQFPNAMILHCLCLVLS